MTKKSDKEKLVLVEQIMKYFFPIPDERSDKMDKLFETLMSRPIEQLQLFNKLRDDASENSNN